MATKTIAVKFGRLTEPLEVYKLGVGTTVKMFLEEKNIEFGPSVRVNGEETSQGKVLREGDIITDIDNVTGGR